MVQLLSVSIYDIFQRAFLNSLDLKGCWIGKTNRGLTVRGEFGVKRLLFPMLNENLKNV